MFVSICMCLCGVRVMCVCDVCVCEHCVVLQWSTVWCYSPRDADLPGIMSSEG